MEHTYAAQKGGRHFKERRDVPEEDHEEYLDDALAAAARMSPTPSPAVETDAEYESDFEVDKEPVTKIEVVDVDNEDGKYDYENDSFIIDDDGANKEGDLTGSSVDVSALDRNNDPKVSQEQQLIMYLEE